MWKELIFELGRAKVFVICTLNFILSTRDKTMKGFHKIVEIDTCLIDN